MKLTIAVVLAISPLFSNLTTAQATPNGISTPLNGVQNYAQVPDVGSPGAGGSRKGGGVRFKPPSLPPGTDGPGGSRSGGASRNGCVAVQTPLTALVPVTEQAAKETGTTVINVWGLTTAQRPTFWFYVPYTKNPSLLAEFVLQDEEENDIHRGAVILPQVPGIISVTVPSTAKALEVGKTYRWYLNVFCDPQKSAPPIFVDGLIQRINLDSQLAKQLSAAKPREQAALYADRGIWFNALTTLGTLRLANPKDATLAADWQTLLQSVGLEPVAGEPLTK